MRALTRWILAAVAAVLIGLPGVGINGNAAAQSGLPQVAQALLEFENNVTWESVSPDWRGRRDTWIATVQGASTPAVLADQLLALEQAMGWHAVEQAWRDRRDGWVAEMRSAGSAAAVAHGLLELEENTLWSAVGDEWRELRDPWIEALNEVP